jgi:hypothetical protein
MDLSVQPLAVDDFDGFINYWLGLSEVEVGRLGVAIDRVPSAACMRSDLEANRPFFSVLGPSTFRY